MAVLDYGKTPVVAVSEMADLHKTMAENNRKQAGALLRLAEENEAKHEMWRRAAEMLEAKEDAE